MGEWKENKLSEFIFFGNGKERPRTHGFIPVFGGNGILGYCDKSNYDGETIIIGRVGAYCGSVYFQNAPVWISDNALAAKPKKGNSAKFFYYYLKNLDLNSYAEGSSHPLITQTLLNSIDISIPSDIKTQTAIAEVLSSLDDKIDLLHRQNKSLEQIAETLFRQWFVEEAEEEWEEKSLDQIAEFLNGLACQKFPPKKGEAGLPVIKIKEMRTGITDASDWATSEVPKKYIIEDGDMLFSWSGSLDVVLWFGGTGVLNQHLFKVSSDIYPQWFYYFWTIHHLAEFKGIAEDKATTMGHIQRHHLSDATVIVPPEKELTKMDRSVDPLFQKIKSNTKQIHILTQIRDTLLPKLMSGEVRVE